MKNKKFLAGEEAGTYIVPEQVTEADILDMALKLARGRLSKGRKIEQPSSAFSYLQTLMHEYEPLLALTWATARELTAVPPLFTV